MNYSEVAIKCKDKAYDMIKNVCQKVDLSPDKIYKDYNEYILHWNHIKWFSEYDDIAAIENVLVQLDEMDVEDYGYKFIRLDEENDIDPQVKTNDNNIELYISRRIDVPDELEERNDTNMTLWNELKKHRGHKISIVSYGDWNSPEDICLECEDCGEVILDAESCTLCTIEDE